MLIKVFPPQSLVHISYCCQVNVYCLNLFIKIKKMMIDNNDEHFDDAENEREKPIDPEKIRIETTNWLETNESVKTYLANFSSYSTESFKRDYPAYKTLWMNSGEYHFQKNLRDDTQWINAAWKSLEVIQQKKLFDAQCLWRAEQVVYKEIEIAFDFKCWEKNVLNCPFIDMINEEDIAMHAHFLEGLNPEKELGFMEDWQDYDEIKEAYHSEDANRNFPEWYDFYNTYKGTSAYLLLPDSRGQKEEYYADAARAKRQHAYAKANINPATQDNRPMISIYNQAQVQAFLKMFETKDLQKNYSDYVLANKTDDTYPFDFDDLLFQLSSIKEQVPIEAHADYKMALYYAVEKYENKKTAESLPIAFEQYILKNSLGIQQPTGGNDYAEIRIFLYQLIIEGREIKGEAPDLDF
jgi:hypothetical protein